MSYFPTVPTIPTMDWQRRVAQATNYLLTKPSELVITTEGLPSAGQRLVHFKSRKAFTIVPAQCFAEAGTAATGSSVFTLKIGGSTAGTVTFAPGATTGTFNITTPACPLLTLFEVIAPSPVDATLANVEILLTIIR